MPQFLALQHRLRTTINRCHTFPSPRLRTTNPVKGRAFHVGVDSFDLRCSRLMTSAAQLHHRTTPVMPSEEVPKVKQRRLSIPLATPRRMPSVAPPPAVQALRIVKRANHSKSESAGGISTVHEKVRPVPSKQATAEGSVLALTRPLRPESSVAQQPAAKMGHGPRRMPVAVESTTNTSNQTSLPLGPRRVPINNAAILSKSSSIATGLKQPTQSMTSSLPRPSGRVASTSTSRLPQLGTSKLRKPTGGLLRRGVSGE